MQKFGRLDSDCRVCGLFFPGQHRGRRVVDRTTTAATMAFGASASVAVAVVAAAELLLLVGKGMVGK